jgi:hypothetical protein
MDCISCTTAEAKGSAALLLVVRDRDEAGAHGWFPAERLPRCLGRLSRLAPAAGHCFGRLRVPNHDSACHHVAVGGCRCGLRRPLRCPVHRTDQLLQGLPQRDFDTRAGSVEVAVPKLREGSYFREWLMERRKRAGRALVSVVATSYLLGVSTRRMEKLVETLGITRLSTS